MKYKYKKSQIFGKRLDIPKVILKKVYNSTLDVKEYFKYELDDKYGIFEQGKVVNSLLFKIIN